MRDSRGNRRAASQRHKTEAAAYILGSRRRLICGDAGIDFARRRGANLTASSPQPQTCRGGLALGEKPQVQKADLSYSLDGSLSIQRRAGNAAGTGRLKATIDNSCWLREYLNFLERVREPAP